jgi:hypothetical protein
MVMIPYSKVGAIGYVPDRSPYDLPTEAWSRVENARFDSRGAGPVQGDKEVLSESSILPTWLMQYPTIREPSWLYADLNSVWVYTKGRHYDISRTGGYTGDSRQRWSHCILNGVTVLNNTVNPPQQWVGFNPSQKLKNLEYWPTGYRPQFIRAFKNYLFAGNLRYSGRHFPYRVMWSHPAAPGEIPISWEIDNPARESGEVDLADTNDYVVDGHSMGDIFLVYKESSIWAFQFIGGIDIFRKWQVSSNNGLLARDCVMPLPGGHLVVGQDDIYVHTGQQGSENSILEYRNRRELFGEIDLTYYYNSFLVKNRRDKEVWFCYPEKGSQFATKALIWNWQDKAIGMRDLPGVPFAFGGYTPGIEDEDNTVWG